MSHQRARFTTKILSTPGVFWGIGSLWLAACTSAELQVPLAHPGHPEARAGEVVRTEALTPAYALDKGASHAAAASDDHAHHHPGAQVPPGGSGTATDGASEPAPASFTCPMHPEVVRAEPGKCPVCNMNLVPKKDGK